MNRTVELSIIIVSFNTRDITRQCLEKIESFAPSMPYEVFVVDNASQDGSADLVEKEFPGVKLVRLNRNKGFAAGNNEGIRRASGRYILLLNSDAFIAEGVIDSTVSHMENNPGVGVLGCKLTDPDGNLQPSARMLPSPLNKLLSMTGLASRFPKSRFLGRADFSWWDHSCPRKVGWVVGAYFLFRRQVIDDIGLLDERYFLYSEEIDFCRSAAEAGWEVVFYPYAQVVHLGGQSSASTGAVVSSKGRQLTSFRVKSELRYYRKWHGPAMAVLIAAIEILWKAAVFAKNLPSGSPKARMKRQEACLTISIIVSMIMEDRLGKG